VEEVQQSRQQYKALKPGLDSPIQANPATKPSDKPAKSRPNSETRGSAENTSPVHRRSYSREASTNRDVLVRQQGDGMEEEVLILNQPQEEVSDKPPSEVHKILAETAPGVRLPETGITLARLPPINDKVELLPTVPKSPLVMEKPKVYPKGTYPPSVMKAREAKFVPYEPYKGAVTQFTNGKHVRILQSRRSAFRQNTLMLVQSLNLPRRRGSVGSWSTTTGLCWTRRRMRCRGCRLPSRTQKSSSRFKLR